jgi:hypothetical protein
MAMVKSNSFWVFVFFICVSCSEDNFPAGFYDYQVTRLLTHDDSKIWQVEGLAQGQCGEPYFYMLNLEGDSIDCYQISWNCDSLSFNDTTYISRGLPTSLGLLFTDSVKWADGDFWLIRSISESQLLFYSDRKYSEIPLSYY